MKKYKKLNLRKLSIAALDDSKLINRIKGGTDDPGTEGTCQTDAINCQTSTRTRTEEDTDACPTVDPKCSRVIGPCM